MMERSSRFNSNMPPHQYVFKSKRPLQRSLIVALLTVALTGCSTVRNTLKPWVCDCAEEDMTCPVESDDQLLAEHGDPAHGDHAHGDHTQGDHEHGDEYDEDEHDLAYGGEHDEPQAPSLRTLRRSAQKEAAEEASTETEESLQPVDAVIARATLDVSTEEARRAVAASRGIQVAPEAGLVVLGGTFVRGEESTAVLIPGKNLRVYYEGSITAQRRLEHHAQGVDLSVVAEEPVAAVQLVRDGSTQILVHYAERSPEGATLYRVAVYKVIGPEVGTVFEQTLARRASDDDPIEHIGRFRVLEGKNHRFIEWIHLDAEGNPAGPPQILRWNHWEGVFRPPTPPPTAPRRQS